jgi:predicted lipase
MSGSKSKNKGNAFEREIANFLSKTYNESFVRAAHSGAFIGGTNNHRKEYLSANQIKSFKGDIIPPDDWKHFNAEAKSYADFPFHLLLSGEHKILDSWLEQLLDVADPDDLNILFMKFNRKGRYVAVQCKLTWITDTFFFYGSEKFGDWYVMEFDLFFKHNTKLVQTYSADTKSITNTDTKSNLTIDI